MIEFEGLDDIEIAESRPNSTPTVPPPPEVTEETVVMLSGQFIRALQIATASREIQRSHVSAKLKHLKTLADLQAQSSISAVAFHLYITYCEVDGGENSGRLKKCVPMALERARISLCSRTDMPKIPQSKETANSTRALRHQLIPFLNHAIAAGEITEDELSFRLACIGSFQQLMEDASLPDGHAVLRGMVAVCRDFISGNGDGDYLNLALISLKTAYPIRRIIK